jgi:hypothetical protein
VTESHQRTVALFDITTVYDPASSFLEYRSIAGCDQNHIALTQRNVELFAEVQQHFPRGLCATGFEEAEMTGGDLGLAREVELTHVALAAPLAQMIAGGFAVRLHVGQSSSSVHYLGGNRDRTHAKTAARSVLSPCHVTAAAELSFFEGRPGPA